MKKTTSTLLLLCVATILYMGIYLNYSAVPGNNTQYPEGWWGWYDQGQYLKSVKAFSSFNFDPQNHRYLPLYALIGAGFYALIPNHPFFFVNLFALLYGIYVFIQVSDRYLSRIETSLILLISLYANFTIFLQYIIPWNSSVTVIIYSLSLHQLIRLQPIQDDNKHSKKHLLKPILFGFLIGLLCLIRPIDVPATFGLFLAYVYLSHRNQILAKKIPVKTASKSIFLLVFGFLLGFSFYLLYNQALYNSPIDGYFKATISSSGYFPTEIAWRTFSLLFDSKVLFAESSASFISHYPWLLLSFIAIIWAMFYGDWLTRTLSFTIVLQFLFYAPYGDLLPNGIWRYHNIHYFKWAFPYLAFLAWLCVRSSIYSKENRFQKHFTAKVSGIIVLGLLILSPHLETKKLSMPITYDAENNLNMHAGGDLVNFIDIPEVTGSFTDIYFGEHKLWVNGRVLQKVKDFRVLPNGAGIRVLFNVAINVSELNLILDPRLNNTHASQNAEINKVSFSFGKPALFKDDVNGYQNK